MDTDLKRAKKIAELNDKFRQSICSPNRDELSAEVVITNGLYDLLATTPGTFEFFSSIGRYDSFKENNDPHSEHDFGSLEWHGETVFWKIDYYDRDLRYGKDPLDVECKRVLTILLASEY